MNGPALIPRHTQLVTVSDAHLLSAEDLRGQRFLALIDQIKISQVKTLVLVGDIFEFILGSNSYFKRKFSKFGEALTSLSETGTKVVYLEGNHEFDLKKLGWPGVEFVVERDYFLDLGGGKLIKFTHGDLVYSPKAYRRFRAVVKSRWFLTLAQIIPGHAMDWLAMRLARASRAQDAYRDLDYGRIYREMKAWLAEDAPFGVFGHFHVPFGDPVPETGGQLLSSASWDEPTALVLTDHQFERLVYQGSELYPYRREQIQPVLTDSATHTEPFL